MDILGENKAYVWEGGYTIHLFPALELLTLPWVEPFFPEMGVPQFIIEHPDVWKPIYEEIVAHYNRLFDDNQQQYCAAREDRIETEEMRTIDALEFHTCKLPRFTLQSLIRGLRQLADIAGKDTAVELEHWVRRHFLSHQFGVSTNYWKIVLQDAVRPAGSLDDLISPPEFIAKYAPIMENLCSVWKEEEQKERVAAARPEPTAEEIAYIDFDSSQPISQEQMRVNKVINQQSTLEVIKLLATNLDEQQQEQFINWAKLQASNISIVDVEDLLVDTFFRADFPFSSSPSLLDLPSTFDLIDYEALFNCDRDNYLAEILSK